MASPAARVAATWTVGAGFQATCGIRRWADGPRKRKSSAAARCVRSFFFPNNMHSVNMLQLCMISANRFYTRWCSDRAASALPGRAVWFSCGGLWAEELLQRAKVPAAMYSAVQWRCSNHAAASTNHSTGGSAACYFLPRSQASAFLWLRPLVRCDRPLKSLG